MLAFLLKTVIFEHTNSRNNTKQHEIYQKSKKNQNKFVVSIDKMGILMYNVCRDRMIYEKTRFERRKRM